MGERVRRGYDRQGRPRPGGRQVPWSRRSGPGGETGPVNDSDGAGAPLTRVVLVRHAHARAIETGVVAGHKGCVGLSSVGRAQAEALGARLARSGFRPDVVATSVLPRAIETADIVARHLGRDPVTTTRDCDLCERHPGEADGLRWDELVARYGALDPFGDPDRPLSPGGESGRAFRQRACAAVERLAAANEGRTVMAVVHGGVILAATLRFLGLAPRSFAHDLANTSLTEWARRPGGAWLLHRFNDAAHLEGSSRPPG